MKRKFGGLLFALILLGLGGHMAFDPAKYDMTDADTSGRRAIYKKAFAAVVNTLGPRSTGMILAGGGAIMLFLTATRKEQTQVVDPATWN